MSRTQSVPSGEGASFPDQLAALVSGLAESQGHAIASAARLAAKAIEGDGFVHLFGTGHSAMPPVDIYPRIGGIEGFNPITELALSRISSVIGVDGLMQASFLERVEGYGEVILQSSPVAPPDVMVIFSNSGINGTAVDVALGSQARGVPVVAVTSVAHSRSTGSRHSSGSKLMDVADVVIDTGVPVGDALVTVPGLGHPVGSASTIMSSVVGQALVVATAEILVSHGHIPLQIHSHNQSDKEGVAAENAMEAALESWGRRMGRRLAELDTKPIVHRQ